MSTALAFLAGSLAAAGAGLLFAPAALRSPRHARLLRLLAGAGRGLRPAGLPVPGDLSARIAAAGRPAGLGARELMAAKLAAALAGGVAGALSPALAPGQLGTLLVTALPVAGFLGPDLWLARHSAERARRVRRELPGLLELLRVTVQAGGSLAESLGEVGRRGTGPLAREWRAVADEVALGVPLAEAMAALEQRLPLAEVRKLVAALARSQRQGAPLAETLSAQALDARFALRRRVQEEAGRAGPKIQLVVALLLVPSVLLLVAAGLVSALTGAGGQLVGV